MSKIVALLRSDGSHRGWMFYCPGCCTHHHASGWDWNGSTDAPTFTPSILVTYNGPDAGVDGAPPARCHMHVRDGRIEYLADCTHALAGLTVDIPELDKE